MPLKVCADSQEAAEVWYETYVLPLLKNNFDGLVTMKGQTTRQQQIDTWSSLDYNATLRTKYQCVPKSTTADGIKTAFCDASFIYMSNGIKACSGGVSDTTCTMGNDCLSLEDKLFEKCSSVYGGVCMCVCVRERVSEREREREREREKRMGGGEKLFEKCFSVD
jgi:hypothetical protein